MKKTVAKLVLSFIIVFTVILALGIKDAQATTSGSTRFYLHSMDVSEENSTYNSMLPHVLPEGNNNSAGTSSSTAFTAAPCESSGFDQDTQAVPLASGASTEYCGATFYGPILGSDMVIQTGDTNSLVYSVYGNISGTGNNCSTCVIRVRLYEYVEAGSTFNLIDTSDSTALNTTITQKTITATPDSSVTVDAGNRLVLVVNAFTGTTPDTSNGTDNINIYFDRDTTSPSYMQISYTLTTQDKATISARNDDDFDENGSCASTCDTATVLTTPTWTIETSGNSTTEHVEVHGSGSSQWMTITDVKSADGVGTSLANYTYAYQAAPTVGDGDIMAQISVSNSLRSVTDPRDLGGLLLRFSSDSDFLILQVFHNGTNYVAQVNDNGVLGSSATITGFANNVILAWSKSGSNYQPKYCNSAASDCTNIANFTNIGSAIAGTGTWDQMGLASYVEYVATNSTQHTAAFEWFDSTVGITVSGTVLSVSGGAETVCAGSSELRLRVSSYTYTASCTDSTGVFSFSPVTAVSSGEGMVVWIEALGTDGVVVVRYDGSGDSTSNTLYESTVSVTSDDTTAADIIDMNTFDNVDDSDIPYTATDATPDTLSVNSGFNLRINLKSGVASGSNVFTPSGTVTLASAGAGNLHVDDNAQATLDTATNSINGDILVDDGGKININADTTITGGDITVASGGDVASSAGTVTMGASGTIGGGSTGSVFQLTNLTVSTGTTTLGADADNTLAFTGDISVSTGATLAMNGKTADVDGGNFTTVGTGTVTCTSCTSGGLTVAGDGTTNGIGGGGTVTVYALTLDGASNTTNAGSAVTVMNNVTVGSSRTLGMGANNLTVGDSAVTNSGGISVTGVISQSSSATTTVKSSSGGAATIGGTGCTSTNCTFYNLTFGPTVASAPTFTLGSAASQVITVSNNLTIGDGTNPVTVNAETNDPTLDVNGNFVFSACTACNTTFQASSDNTNGILKVAGNWSNVSAGVFTPNTGIVLMDGTSGSPKTITSAGDSFNNLSIDNGGTAITWELQDALDVNGNLLIDTSNTLDAKSGGNFNVNVAGNWTNNGTYTAQSNTTTLDGAGGTTQTVTGATTFYQLSVTTSTTRVLQFTHTTTYTVSNNITLTGTSCNALLIFRSSSLGTAYTIANSDASPTVSYTDFQDTTVTTNTFSSGSGITNSGGNTGVTSDNTCEGGSNSADASNYSFQRKTFKDSTNSVHWLFFHDGDQIEYKYSSNNGTNWTRGGSLAYDTNDFSVWQGAISGTEYVWLAVDTGDDILVRRGTLAATSITWDSEANVVALNGASASDTYAHAFISLDSSNYMWVLGRYYDGSNYKIRAVRSDVNDTGEVTWSGVGFGTTVTVQTLSDDQTNSNAYGNIVPLASQDMYATFVAGTALEGCVWDHTPDARFEDSSGNACSPVAGTTDSEGSSTRGTGGVKIDDTSNFGALIGGGGQVVQTSDGILYTVVNNAGSCEVWRSTNGSSWTQQDSSNNPSCTSASEVSLAIDSDDNLHIAYEVVSTNHLIKYVKFTVSSNTFGSAETAYTGGVGGTYTYRDIAVDVNDVPHIIYDLSSAGDTFVRYVNRVGGSWNGVVTLETITSGGPINPSIAINEDNIPEISYINSADADLTAAVGNQNNASSFTLHDVDSLVSNAAGTRGSSIGVDIDGNTWIVYVDDNTSNEYLTLVKHNDADAWTTWQTPTTTSNHAFEPSLSIIGKTVFITYEDDLDDVKYDIYDSGTDDWLGETNLATGTFQDVKVRYGKYNFHEPWLMDFLYSDGTDVYWSYVDLRATKVDDASNFAFNTTYPGKQTVRTSNGNIYSVLFDSNTIEVWKSSDGYVWEEQHTAGKPTCEGGQCINSSIGLRSTGVIDIVYIDFDDINGAYDLDHITFNTSTDTFGSNTNVRNPAAATSITDLALSTDASDKAHIVWAEGSSFSYSNNVGGTFKSPVTVEALSPGDVDITIDIDGKPQVAYINSTDDDLTVRRGDLNDATEFTTAVQDVDTDISDIAGQRGLNIAVDTLTGDTWVAYTNDTGEDNSGTNDAVTLAKHAYADGWTTWSTVTTKTDVGYEPSIAIVGSSDIYVFYQEDSTDQKIVYDVYDGSAWDSETVLQTPSGVDFKNVKTKWSFEWNNFGANRIDYLFNDGTDVYWDYLYVRRSPINIDNASDFGGMINDTRQIVRTSDGVLYSVLNDGGTSVEVWKSADGGNSWFLAGSKTITASTGAPTLLSAAVDSSNYIHIAYALDGGAGSDAISYDTFNTGTSSFTALNETVVAGGATLLSLSLALDTNDIPHVAATFTAADTVVYENRVGGAWIGSEITVESLISQTASLAISDENIPEIVYINATDDDLTAAVGNANDATSFTLQDVDQTVDDTNATRGASIAIDSSGNTWIGYRDSDGFVNLAKHLDASAWSSWETLIETANTASEPTISIDGSNIYAFYEDDQDDVVYNKYNGTTWSGEVLMEEHGALQDVKVRWSYLNNFDSNGSSVVQNNTYYFDNSDSCTTTCQDPGSVWSSESNGFDGSTSTFASTTSNSTDDSTNYLRGNGTNSPTSGDTIVAVSARVYGVGTDTQTPADKTISAKIYTESLGEVLGTAVRTGFSAGWGSFTSLSTPTGGWTWSKISNLNVKVYCGVDAAIDTCNLYRVEVLVRTINTSTQTEIDYIYSDGTDGFYNRLISGGTPGSQDAIDTVPTGLTKSLSAVSDSTNYDVHLVFVDDESTDQISYRRWDSGTTTWQSAALVADAASANDAYPSISIETSTRDLTTYWIDTSANVIFYSLCDVSAAGSECSAAADWAAETSWKTGSTFSAINSNYSEANETFAEWSVGSTHVTIDWDRVTFAATTSFTLSNYRWYVDPDTLDVTDAWSAASGIDLAENTELPTLPVAYDPLSSTQEIRLRVGFTVNNDNLSATEKQFKLQYKEGTDSSCTSGAWTDLGGANAWAYATSTVSDGSTIITTRLAGSDVGGQYAKSAPTTANANTATTTQDIEYDFHIIAGSAYSGATRYLFRVVESAGTVFDSYTNCPALSTEPGTEHLMRHGEFYTNFGEQGFWWAD